jgi:acetyl esterase
VASDTPFIDPELVAAGALLKSRGLVALSLTTSPVAEARAALGRISAFLNEGSVPLQHERDLAVPGPHGSIPCRLYLPDGVVRPPLIVYAHGGSFALGDLDGWNVALRELVRGSGVATLAVDYRLAPEHRFPVASDEMIAVIRFMAGKGDEYGIDPVRMAAGGDSAGANLALGSALALRDAGSSPLRFLLLLYGAFSTDGDSASWRRFGTGTYGLSQAQLAWIWGNYLTCEQERTDWRVAPLLAPLHGLPQAFLAIGSLDPLQDDNHRLVRKLEAAGVPCKLTTYEGLNHGFIRYGRLIGATRRAIAEAAAALRDALAQPNP